MHFTIDTSVIVGAGAVAVVLVALEPVKQSKSVHANARIGFHEWKQKQIDCNLKVIFHVIQTLILASKNIYTAVDTNYAIAICVSFIYGKFPHTHTFCGNAISFLNQQLFVLYTDSIAP